MKTARQSLELAWSTPCDWAEAVLEEPLALLVDHAHCELGAASTAQTLIARYPEFGSLVDRLASLAAEELRHFQRVHRLILHMGGNMQPIRSNPYAGSLVRKIDRAAPDALCDRLLVSALIERRSLERFGLLAEAGDRCVPAYPELAVMFQELQASEAGHALLFVELARTLFPAVDVDARLARWAEVEGELVRGLEFAPRIHSGPPAQGGSSAESRPSTEAH